MSAFPSPTVILFASQISLTTTSMSSGVTITPGSLLNVFQGSVKQTILPVRQVDLDAYKFVWFFSLLTVGINSSRGIP